MKAPGAWKRETLMWFGPRGSGSAGTNEGEGDGGGGRLAPACLAQPEESRAIRQRLLLPLSIPEPPVHGADLSLLICNPHPHPSPPPVVAGAAVTPIVAVISVVLRFQTEAPRRKFFFFFFEGLETLVSARISSLWAGGRLTQGSSLLRAGGKWPSFQRRSLKKASLSKKEYIFTTSCFPISPRPPTTLSPRR